MKCLVTGADGFIGSHLTEKLVSEGHEVTALARYNAIDTYGWLDECEGMHKVRGDVLDTEQMRRLVAGQDIVFHLAALGSVPYSYDAPRSVFETNALGTLNIAEACLYAGAKLVHTSTSEVFGTARYVPQDAAHPLQAQSPYAASKIAADKLVESYFNTYDLPFVILRPFNTYGPRQSQRAVIPAIIRQALDSECREIRIGSGNSSRDLTYVDDTVSAFLKVMDRSGVWQVGSGESVRIGELARLISDMTYPKDVVSEDERKRPADSEVWELCCKSDFKTEHTLSEGLQKTIDWWRSRPLKDRGYMV